MRNNNLVFLLVFLCGCSLANETDGNISSLTPTSIPSASASRTWTPLPSDTPTATLWPTMDIAGSLSSGEYLVDFLDSEDPLLSQPAIYSITGEQVLLLPAIPIGVFSPDLNYLEELDYLSIVNLKTGVSIPIDGLESCGMDVSWSSDSKYLISLCENGDLSNPFLISVEDHSAKQMTDCSGDEHFCDHLSLSPDKKWVAYYYNKMASGSWDEEGLHIMSTMCSATPTTCISNENGIQTNPPFAWSPDSQYIATRGNDETIDVYKVESKNLLFFRSYKISEYFYQIAWSPSGEWLALSSANGVLLVSTTTGEITPVDIDKFYYWISVPVSKK